MDIRIAKTRSAIRQAFLELRSRKPLEKISVKELCTLAQINKSTFYSHYTDIYHLSDAIEDEIIEVILNDLSPIYQYSADNPELFAREIMRSCLVHLPETSLVFSESMPLRLGVKLEKGIKERICQKYPHFEEDPQKNVLLSFCIQGANHAFWCNSSCDPEIIADTIEQIIRQLQPLYS